MSINQRFKDLIKFLNFNPTSFSKEIKISQTAIRRILDGENQPSPKVLTFLLDRYPNLNITWLLTGRGEMFVNDTNGVGEPEGEYKNKYLLEIEALKKENELLKNSLSDKEEIIQLLKKKK